MITSYFSKYLFKFLRNNIEYIVSSAVLGAVSGPPEAALLRVLAIQCAFADDYFK